MNRACTSSIAGGLRLRVGERAVLAVVVAQHERRDLVGHLPSSSLRSATVSSPARDDAVEQDLDVHLVVGRVDAGAVVDRVGVDQATRERELDPAPLREAEVAALADDAARSSAPSTRTASLALSPTSACVSACAFT